MWVETAPAWPFVLPIFFSFGVLPGACVYLMAVPPGYGPNTVPDPRSMTSTSPPPVFPTW